MPHPPADPLRDLLDQGLSNLHDSARLADILRGCIAEHRLRMKHVRRSPLAAALESPEPMDITSAVAERATARPYTGSNRMVVVVLCLMATGILGLVWLSVLIALFAILVELAVIHVRVRRARFAAQVAAQRCTGCGYDLASLPEAIPPALADDIRFGPHICPECGRKWPLVPPPTWHDPGPA